MNTEPQEILTTIEAVRRITADAVAKKQQEEKLNYPKVLDEIRAKAALGKSSCTIGLYAAGELTKKLLEADGFKVSLTDIENNNYMSVQSLQSRPTQKLKEWTITW